jgi:FkbM family methyltransferase
LPPRRTIAYIGALDRTKDRSSSIDARRPPHLEHRLITFQYEGTEVRFDDEGVDEANPGQIHGVLRTGVFYEEQFLRYIRSLGLDGCYLDIGANVGTHTIYFARMCGAEHVHSFEPQPAACERLRKNVALNDVSSRVTVHQIALTDEPCEVALTFGRQVDISTVPKNNTSRRTVVVPGKRLDDVISDRVTLIKMDVEGMEPAVLKGAYRLIRSSRPVIFAEAGTADEYAAVYRIMRQLGYRPTGRCFNSTPTYEFVSVSGPIRRAVFDASAAFWRLVRSPAGRRAGRLLPGPARRRLKRVLRRNTRNSRTSGAATHATALSRNSSSPSDT